MLPPTGPASGETMRTVGGAYHVKLTAGVVYCCELSDTSSGAALAVARGTEAQCIVELASS